MDFQDGFPSVDIRAVHQDLPVEPPRAQQGGIQDFRPVGGGHDDDPFIGFKSIHLHQELVEGLLPFVMPAHDIHPPGFAQGVQFIDEDDARGLRGGLREKIANARRAHADEHLHKLGAADAEERHFRLPGHGPGQKGFAGSRRADQQHPFGDSAAQFLEFFRRFEKFDNFLEFFLGFIDAGHIGKRDLGVAFCKNFGLALAKDMTPIPGPIFFMANRQIRKNNAHGNDPGQNAAQKFAFIAAGITDLVLIQFLHQVWIIHANRGELLVLCGRFSFVGSRDAFRADGQIGQPPSVTYCLNWL